MSALLKAKVENNLQNGEGSEYALNEARKRASSYFTLLAEIELAKSKKLKALTSELERNASVEKQNAFPKPKRNAWDVCAHAFIRVYDPEKVEVIPLRDYVGVTNLSAIYGGKRLTIKGKIVYQWCVTSPTMINEEIFKLGALLHFIEV